MQQNTAVDEALRRIDGDFIKALTEPARIEILKQLICDGPKDVKGLAEQMTQDRSVVSRHLTLMKDAGLLRARKQGRHVYYSIDHDQALRKAEELVGALRRCSELGCC